MSGLFRRATTLVLLNGHDVNDSGPQASRQMSSLLIFFRRPEPDAAKQRHPEPPVSAFSDADSDWSMEEDSPEASPTSSVRFAKSFVRRFAFKSLSFCSLIKDRITRPTVKLLRVF